MNIEDLQIDLLITQLTRETLFTMHKDNEEDYYVSSVMSMSDEEKKAIVELNHFSNMTAYWKQEEYTNSEIDNYIKIVLNLIEKQSKEIEKLNKSDESKEQSSMKYYNLYRELVDKIKSKIEEWQKEKEFYDKDEDREWGQYNNWDWVDTIINEMQSLLEKE